jgi:hypothetical protein
MNETTRPMSKGRYPDLIGVVTVSQDNPLYPEDSTNREVAFPSYPSEAKGYISEGYGIAGGSTGIILPPIGYNQRTVTSGTDTWEYLTPKFNISVNQGDVVHRPWIGVVITVTADQTTNVYDFVFPGPEVLVSSTSTPQTFTYIFSSADDPTIGSPDYYLPNQTLKEVIGTEYLYSSLVYTSATDYTRTETIPTGFLAPQLVWYVTATTPP